MPISPSSPIFATSSYGKDLVRSSSSAIGATSCRANSRTVSRSNPCSSVRSKFTRAGSLGTAATRRPRGTPRLPSSPVPRSRGHRGPPASCRTWCRCGDRRSRHRIHPCEPRSTAGPLAAARTCRPTASGRSSPARDRGPSRSRSTVALRPLAVGAPLDDVLVHHPLQPGSEHVARDAERALHLGELAPSVEDLADDQQGPTLAHQLEAAGYGANLSLVFVAEHECDLRTLGCITQLTLVGSAAL